MYDLRKNFGEILILKFFCIIQALKNIFCLLSCLKPVIFAEIVGSLGLVITKPCFQSGFSALSCLPFSWILALFFQGKCFNFKVRFLQNPSVSRIFLDKSSVYKYVCISFKKIYKFILQLMSLTLFLKVCRDVLFQQNMGVTNI